MGSGKEGPPQHGLKEGAVGVGGFSEGSWLTFVITLSRKSAMGWNGHWGGCPPSPKYWRVSARRMRAAGGPPGTQRSSISGESASNGCPPWGYYLQGPGQKRPFQPSTSCNRN